MTRQTDDDPSGDDAGDGTDRDAWVSNVSTNSLVWITAFVVLFTVVGTLAPSYYYTYSDSEKFLAVHSTTVSEQDANTTAVQVTIDRTARRTYAGTLTIELSRYREGYVERITTSRLPVVFEAGRQTTKLTLQTPPLPPGDYHLTISGTITLPHGVERQFAWESNTFAVSTNETRVPDPTPTPTATPSPTPAATETENATATP